MDNLSTFIEGITEIECVDSNNDMNAEMFRGVSNSLDFLLFIRCTFLGDINWLKRIESTKKILRNDKFNKFIGSIDRDIELQIIFPATQEDLNKYIKLKQSYLETYSMYKEHVLPKAMNQNKDWMYNILDGKNEQEDIIYSDSDFVIIPDIKWDKHDINSLYLLVITQDRGLLSIRDLNNEHLELLKKIKKVSAEIVEKKYGFNESDLRMYFHYYPTFWHLHMHINLIKKRYPGASVDNCHLLDSVINNISLVSDYYKVSSIRVKADPQQYYPR